MNHLGHSMRFDLRTANIWTGGSVRVLALALLRPLAGELRIAGIADADGQPVTWTLPPGTVAGVYTAPAAGQSGGNLLSYKFSNASDNGSTVIAFS